MVRVGIRPAYVPKLAGVGASVGADPNSSMTATVATAAILVAATAMWLFSGAF